MAVSMVTEYWNHSVYAVQYNSKVGSQLGDWALYVIVGTV